MTHQLDATLSPWRELRPPHAPSGGWAAHIRQAMGMSAVALARRLGVTPAAASKLEKAEGSRTITLASLDRIADALGCDVQYALVPRQPLAQMRLEQARRVAQEELGPVARTMALEDQSVSAARQRVQVDQLAQEILSTRPQALWK